MKAKLEARVQAMLEKAEFLCLKHGAPWLRAPYLLGAICCEMHRQAVAHAVCVATGWEELLDGKPPVPCGWVGSSLVSNIEEKAEELRTVMSVWGLTGEAIGLEWASLANTGEQMEGHYFNGTTHPLTYNIFIDRLFVGFSDTTVLESMVSQYRTFSDLRMDPVLVEAVVLYQQRLGGDRQERLQLRSSSRGGLRKESLQKKEEGKALPRCKLDENKDQLLGLCQQSLRKALSYDANLVTAAAPPPPPPLSY
jgi:hypothetical protein